jgi:quercetin 2,3-dioxygenase
MITLLRAEDRVHRNRRGHESWFTFPSHETSTLTRGGFGTLRGLNEERFAPRSSSSQQRCRDTEIVTYVHDGTLGYWDSTGRAQVIQAGEFHRMTAGPGMRRTESNASRRDPAHVFQIWLQPQAPGLESTCELRRFSAALRRNALRVVASGEARDGSLRIHQDAVVCSALLTSGQHLVHEIALGRAAWLHVVRGQICLGDLVLNAGDGVGTTEGRVVSMTAQSEAEVLLIDVVAPAPNTLARAAVG